MYGALLGVYITLFSVVEVRTICVCSNMRTTFGKIWQDCLYDKVVLETHLKTMGVGVIYLSTLATKLSRLAKNLFGGLGFCDVCGNSSTGD